MERPLLRRSQGHGKACNFEQRITFGNYHFNMRKHAENLYAVHLCRDIDNLYGVNLAMSLDTWADFVSVVIHKVKLARYDIVPICR